ncbi:MAG: TAXI family TRAP transporter solute-binding subunit [Burkholderiales bacterium]|nr:MAG: TAXI family TRAP transporter solute-binding subunit [Burkholderiales bacterium]
MTKRNILAIVAVASAFAAAPAAAQNVLIKSGPQGGVWYPVSAGLAGVLKDKAGMNATVQTGGGVSNAVNVGNGQAQIGFTTSGVAKDTYSGAGGKPPMKDLRLFGVLYNQYYTLAVPADGEVKTVKDLKGRRLVTQRKGSSTEKMTRDVLEANGLKYDDLSKMNFAGNVGDATNQVKDRQVDGFSALIAHPAGYMMEMASSADVNIVALDKPAIDYLVKNFSGYSPITLKAGTYPWLKADVPTVNAPVIMVTNANVPDDVAYRMAKAWFENHETLVNVHEVMKQFTPGNASADPVIPIHPGALRYYKEVGAVK